MLHAVALAAQALAVWRAAETDIIVGIDDESLPTPEVKAFIAQAYEQFVQACFDVAFDLAPKLFSFGEYTSAHDVRYTATPSGGGLVIQKMDLDPANSGVMLVPGQVPINAWLQLIIDLPELLKALEVK